eukprot:gene5571-6134_t
MTSQTGFVFEEACMWHEPGNLPGTEWVEPVEHWENVATKRRLYNLLSKSGVLEQLVRIKSRAATREEILKVHDESYLEKIVELSRGRGGDGGELATFGHGGYEIAALSAGGVLSAVDAVTQGTVRNAYCLVRPPGHHAEPDKGMGFCIFNNIAIAAHYARSLKSHDGKPIQKIAIVDYDVHHGNGTEKIFWNDPDCLFISLHQDNNYPAGGGAATEIGGETAKGSNINIPLPAGSGTAAYRLAFEKIVLPSLDLFKPDFIFVSSGFDASYADPLARMMLSSECYGDFARWLKAAAERWCDGRLIFAHEGGYSKDYVPFCGLAVIEAISGISSAVFDHNLPEINGWNHQGLLPHQLLAIHQVCKIHSLPTSDFSLSEEEESIQTQMNQLLSGLSSERRTLLLNNLLLH